MTITSHSEAETAAIAAGIARRCKAGACIALHGDLGAGKTRFVRGIVEGLGGDQRHVSSPTYTLLNIYPTPTLSVFHLDAYRVAGPDDFENIGFAEFFEQNAIIVVEWASRIQSLLPADTITVTIEPTGKTRRRITIDPYPVT